MSETGFVSRRALWLSRLSDEVTRGLAERIRSGALPTGAALPSREALAAEFVTSDGVVDQAIGKLLAEALVVRDAAGEIRVASPRQLAERFRIPEAAEATIADVIAILELRVGVETEAAALAALRRSDAQLSAIREAAAAHAAAGEAGAAQADYRFHQAIGLASENRYIHDLTDYLGPLFIPRMRVELPGGRKGGEDVNIRNARAEHALIVEAIAAQDPAAAREAMRRHLERTLDLMRSIEAAG